MTLHVAAIAQQWTLFVGVVLVVGCVAWMLYVAPRAGSIVTEEYAAGLGRVDRRVASMGAVTATLLVAVWVARGAIQLVTFRDPFVPLGEDVSFLLFDVFWGTVWMGQGAVVLLLSFVFLLLRLRAGDPEAGSSGRAGVVRLLAAGLTVALVASMSLSSHAMAVETARPLAVLADAVHLLAVGTWIGCLAVLLIVTREEGDLLFAAQIRAFSPMALASVATLIVMGVGLAWTHLHSVSDLWRGAYGRLLSGKLLVAAAVFITGFWNWRRGLPSLDGPTGAPRLRYSGALEVATAAAVLLLTAALVQSARP